MEGTEFPSLASRSLWAKIGRIHWTHVGKYRKLKTHVFISPFSICLGWARELGFCGQKALLAQMN